MDDILGTDRLLEITGGWPTLIERTDEFMSADASTATVLTEFAATQRDDADASQVLVLNVLAGAPPIAGDVFTILTQEPSSTVVPEDLVLMLEGECADPAAVVGALRALGLIRATDEGEIPAEPLAAQAWMATISMSG